MAKKMRFRCENPECDCQSMEPRQDRKRAMDHGIYPESTASPMDVMYHHKGKGPCYACSIGRCEALMDTESVTDQTRGAEYWGVPGASPEARAIRREIAAFEKYIEYDRNRPHAGGYRSGRVQSDADLGYFEPPANAKVGYIFLGLFLFVAAWVAAIVGGAYYAAH